VCPTRCEKNYKNLSETEAIELWVSAKKIADSIKKFYNVIISHLIYSQTDAVQLTIQDGDDAGQTVNHCHIHLIPVTKRISIGSLDSVGNNIFHYNQIGERQDRSEEDMINEAELYRLSFSLN